MSASKGSIHFEITADNDDLKRKLAESRQAILNSGQAAEAEGSKIEGMFKRAAMAAGGFLSIDIAKNFGMQLIEITGKFQTFQAVLTNTLQSPQKAKEAMSMLQEFAATTPFQVDDLTGAFVKLANQGFVPTYDEMVKLGDLASSTGKGFDQLSEAIIDAQTGEFERLKDFGIRASKEGDQVAFTFKEQKTQVDFTASSIRDYVLSLGELSGVQGANAEIAKTLTGQMSNLEDGITQMMNEIGQSSQGMLSGALSGASMLVENYEAVGKTLATLVVAYGSYKGAIIATNAVQNVITNTQYSVEIDELSKLLPLKQSVADADIQQALASGKVTQAKAEQLMAIRAEAQAELEQLRVKQRVLAAQMAEASKEDALALKQALNAERKERAAREELSSATLSGNAQKIRRAEIKLTCTEEELNIALKNRSVTADKLSVIQSKANSVATAAETLQQGINTAGTVAATRAKNIFTAATVRLSAAMKSMKVAFTSNPFGLLLTAITTIMTATSLFNKQLDGTSGQFGEFAIKIKEEEGTFKDLKKAILQTTEGTQERADIIKLINSRYPGYLDSMLTERSRTEDIISALTTANEKMLENIKMKLKVSQLEGILSKQLQTDAGFIEKQVATFSNADKSPEQVALFTKEMATLVEKARQGKATIDDARAVLIAQGEDEKWINNAIISSDSAASKKLREITSGFYAIKKAAQEAGNSEQVLDALLKSTGVIEPKTKPKLEEKPDKKDKQREYDKLIAKQREVNESEKTEITKKGVKDRRELAQLEYDQEMAFIANSRQEAQEALPKGGVFDDSEFIRAEADADARRKEKLSNIDKDDLASMRDYLKEYGTFQQQKLVIAEEYAEKIKTAQNAGEKLKFEKERDAAIQNKEVGAIKQNIDWQSLFGEFGTILKDQLQPTIDNLKTLTKSDEFKNSSLEDQQKVYNMITDLESKSVQFGKDMFKDVAIDLAKYQQTLRQLNKAQELEKKAYEDLTAAKEKLSNAEQRGEDTTSAKQIVDTAQQTFDQASESVKTFSGQAAESSEQLRNSSSKAMNALNSLSGLAPALSELKSGSLQGVGKGLMGIDKIFNSGKITKSLEKNIIGLFGKDSDAAKTLSGALDGGLISAILSILDVLKEGIGSIISSLIDTVLGAVSGILDNLLSGDIFVQTFNSFRNGIGGILDALTWGAFSSWVEPGNAKDVNSIVGELTDSNKYLITAIEKLTDAMGKSGGLDATKYYSEAHDAQLEKQENDRNMLEAKMGYTSAHHSNNYYINKAFNVEDWKEASRLVGKELKSASDLWKLTPEELAKFQESPDLWDKINSGKYDQSEWLDRYIANSEELVELDKKWKESMNQLSLESFGDSFLSTLMDMDASSQDFADNFEEYLKKSILNALIADNYAEDIEKLYDQWAADGADGKYTKEEIEALRKSQKDLSDKMIADRDAMAEIFDWESESSRQGMSKGIATASQESVDENNGRLTAIQGHTYELNETLKFISPNIASIKDSIDFIRDNAANQLIALYAIRDNTAPIAAINADITAMRADISTLVIHGVAIR